MKYVDSTYINIEPFIKFVSNAYQNLDCWNKLTKYNFYRPVVVQKSFDIHYYRPWYVEAATPSSKDVIMLVDISGSMLNDFEGRNYLFIAKEAAETVLDTLNPKDRVSIIRNERYYCFVEKFRLSFKYPFPK